MNHAHSLSNRAVSTPVIVSSFIGIVMGLLFSLGLNSLMTNRVGAIESPHPVSQTSAEDFARFAYAYNQGYEARATSAGGDAAACAEVPMPGMGGGVSARSEANASGAVASATTVPYASPVSWGGSKHKAASPQHSSDRASYRDRMSHMVNSYNTYNSSTSVNNTSSVTNTTTNTNSNNTVGSHNTSSNEIRIEDSRGVHVGVSSNQQTTSNQASNSFNEDSYNTTTNTTTNTAIDSFNKETNIAVNSGNTVTENTNVTKIEGSYNSDNDTTTTNTTNNTTNTNTENSHNSTEVGDIDVDVDLARPGRGHLSAI